jgi:NAD dependent epimerase/dehydratase family enzyme
VKDFDENDRIAVADIFVDLVGGSGSGTWTSTRNDELQNSRDTRTQAIKANNLLSNWPKVNIPVYSCCVITVYVHI